MSKSKTELAEYTAYLVLEVVDEVPGEGDLLAGDKVAVLAVLGVALQVALQVRLVGRPEPAELAVVPPLVRLVHVPQVVGRGVSPDYGTRNQVREAPTLIQSQNFQYVSHSEIPSIK